MYEAKVRKGQGPWERTVRGKTAREVKRKLAKEVGLPVRLADSLPLGRSTLVGAGEWTEAKVAA